MCFHLKVQLFSKRLFDVLYTSALPHFTEWRAIRWTYSIAIQFRGENGKQDVKYVNIRSKIIEVDMKLNTKCDLYL